MSSRIRKSPKAAAAALAGYAGSAWILSPAVTESLFAKLGWQTVSVMAVIFGARGTWPQTVIVQQRAAQMPSIVIASPALLS